MSNDNRISDTPQPWDALKNELEDLLGQVQDQITEIETPKAAPVARRAPQAVDDLEERRAAALSNVRNAVARLDAKKAEPKKKKKKKKKAGKNDLDAAIAQIRASTEAMNAPAPAEHYAPEPEAPRAPARQQQWEENQLSSIISQIEGLHRSIRDLTGTVADASHFERIEGQIADLAGQIEQHSSPQADAIGDQLDGLQYALERLAELQIRQIGHIEQLKEHQTEHDNGEQAARLEESIRAIYDKFDALEQSIDRPNSSIETIAKGIASIARAVSDIQKRGHADHGPQILAEIEDVARRLNKLEQPTANQARLSEDVRQEMHGLRGQLVNALEPRFTALESRLDDFAANISAPAQAQNHEEIFARLEGFEDRLTSAIERVAQAQTGAAAPQATNGVTLDALRGMEGRLADALKQVRQTSSVASNGENVSAETLEAMEKRISTAIGRLQQELPEAGARQFESLKAIESKLATSLKKLETMTSKDVSAPSNVRQVHVSSGKPNAELKFEPHPNAIAPRAELRKPAAEKPAPVAAAPQKAEPAQVPAPQPKAPPQAQAQDEVPPRPRSFLAPDEGGEKAFTKTAPAPQQTDEAPDERTASKDSFIAAARRAAQGRAPEPVANEPKKSGGLLGKALARLKPTPKADDEAAAKVVAEKKEPEVKREDVRVEKPQTRVEPPVLNTPSEKQADAAFEEEDHAKTLTVGPERARPQSLNEEAPKPRSVLEMEAAERGEGENEPRESFLSRNRQPILLGASIVAIIAMTANLVLENKKPEADRTIPQSAEQVDVSEAPRQISLSDVENALAAQSEPMPSELAALTDGIGLSDQQVELVAPQPPGIDQTTTASIPNAPVPVSLPPVELGPEALREAAANGDPRAQYEIGMIYAEGKAVGKDSQQAVVWYETAAAQGFANAQYRLGTAYEHGMGVEKDLEQAKLWYLRAAEAGNRMSMHNLAALLASAPDDQRDFNGAARWFEEAAKRGVVDSQFNLGMLYARGLGVSQDFAESYKWFAIAAAHGDKDAAKARDDVAKSIEATQMSEVKEKLASWQPEQIDLKANFAPIGTWTNDFDPGKEIAKKEVVLSVQIALSKLGFDLGQPDGLAGPKTRDAIRQFERALGMTESGEINPRLLTVLSSQPV
jgi:localization factor PodJL